MIQQWLIEIGKGHGYFVTLAAMMGMILAAGCVTESVAVILILGPILAPVAAALNINPVHWGIIFTFGTSIGFVTPPYGLNLFVTAAVMQISYGQLVRAIMVFLIPLLVSWVMVAAVPWLTLAFIPTR